MDAQILRRLRKEQQMNQKQLAALVGVSASAIGMYEQGRREPDHATLQKLAEVLHVSVDYLLGKEPPEEVIDRDALAEELFRNLMEQNALMFRAEHLTEEDYAQLADAVKLAVDITVERKRKRGEP